MLHPRVACELACRLDEENVSRLFQRYQNPFDWSGFCYNRNAVRVALDKFLPIEPLKRGISTAAHALVLNTVTRQHRRGKPIILKVVLLYNCTP